MSKLLEITREVREYADGLSDNEKTALYPADAQTRGEAGAPATDREIREGMEKCQRSLRNLVGRYISMPTARSVSLLIST